MSKRHLRIVPVFAVLLAFLGSCSRQVPSNTASNSNDNTYNISFPEHGSRAISTSAFHGRPRNDYDYNSQNDYNYRSGSEFDYRNNSSNDYDYDYDYDYQYGADHINPEHCRGDHMEVVLEDLNIDWNTFNENKSDFFLYLLPDLIDFLRYIKENTDEDTQICFLSRDCYFLNKLYAKMYPEDNNFEYVYSSRKLCYSGSSHYREYIKNIMDKKQKTLWVDMQGSGDSHVYFFQQEFGYVPTKVFFKLNDLRGAYTNMPSEKRAKAKAIDNSIYENSLVSFKTGEWGIKVDNRDVTKGSFYIEGLSRAPHASVIGLDSSMNPIYEKDHEFMDKNLDELFSIYDEIVDSFWVDNSINLRTTSNEHNVYKNSSSERWNGLLALDIDETITGDHYSLLDELVDYSNDNNIKIVFITARRNPFATPRNGHLKDIMKYFQARTDYPIDIWYNPFSSNKPISSIAEVKVQQLDYAREELNLPKNKCMLVDDILFTVSLAKRSGYEHSTWVSYNNKIGINQETIANVKKMNNQDSLDAKRNNGTLVEVK